MFAYQAGTFKKLDGIDVGPNVAFVSMFLRNS